MGAIIASLSSNLSSSSLGSACRVNAKALAFSDRLVSLPRVMASDILYHALTFYLARYLWIFLVFFRKSIQFLGLW